MLIERWTEVPPWCVVSDGSCSKCVSQAIGRSCLETPCRVCIHENGADAHVAAISFAKQVHDWTQQVALK